MFESKRDVVKATWGTGWGGGRQVTDGLEKAEMRINQGTIAIKQPWSRQE